MRLWLLLASLLVSGLSPLGDGDGVMENYSWSLYRKLLLNGQMTPGGLQRLQTQTEHHCMCIQRNCVYVVAQHRRRASPFFWAYTVHNDDGHSLSHQEFTGISHTNHIPALVVFLPLGMGESVPAFLVRSLPALHVISEIIPTTADVETSHIAMDIKKDHPDSRSAWLLHHHTAAPGHNFQASSLEKCKSLAPSAIVHLQKVLTKRRFKKSGITSALKIKRASIQQMAQPLIRQKASTQHARDIDVLMGHDAQRSSKSLVSQQDVFQAATLLSGSSPMKTSDISQLETQRNPVRVIKKNKHLNLDAESLLRKDFLTQRSLKAASSVHVDGFYDETQLLLVFRENRESINRPQYKMKAMQDDNKEDFSRKIITRQAELRRPEGRNETEQSSTNTIETGEKLKCIQQADFKSDKNDHQQHLSKVGEEILIMILLPDKQIEPPSHRKLLLNTDTAWKTINITIKELYDSPTITKVIEGNFISEVDNLKCKYAKENQLSLKIYKLNRAERMDIKPAEGAAKLTAVSASTEEQVKETREKTEHTEDNNTPRENMSINRTKQEGNVPESVVLSPPSLRMMATEAAKAEHTADTTATNMQIKETTSSTDVFNRGRTQRDDGLQSTEATASPESETEPRVLGSKTNEITPAATEESLSGLRMRENMLADTTDLRQIAGNEGRAATGGPETAGEEDQSDPELNSFTKPSQTNRKQATGMPRKLMKISPPLATDDNVPLCRGLIHRTEAGWKHCVERFAAMGSKMVSSRELTDTFKATREQTFIPNQEHKDDPLIDDKYNHFYYFDGVLRRVQNDFYPYFKRRRWGGQR